MVFCAAYGCSSRSFPRGGFSNITERRRFFCFPKTEQQKKRWITAVKRQALTVTKYTKLCDLHFLPSDFTERGYLKPNAVPLSPYVTKEHTARKIASEKRYHERTKRKELLLTLYENTPEQEPCDAIVSADDHSDILQNRECGNHLPPSATFQHDCVPAKVSTTSIGTAVHTCCIPKCTKEVAVQTESDDVLQADGFHAVKHDHTFATPLLDQPKPRKLVLGIDRQLLLDTEPIFSSHPATSSPLTTSPPVSLPVPGSPIPSHINRLASCDGNTDTDMSFLSGRSDRNDGQDVTFDPEMCTSESSDESVETPAPVSRCAVNDDKYIVFESSLDELITLCKLCRSPVAQVKKYRNGTNLKVSILCLNHCSYTWSSQPNVSGMAAGNLLAAAAILFSGITYQRFLQWASLLRLAMISESTFYAIQRNYLWPVVQEAWIEHQEVLLQDMKHTSLKLAGDGRCDSPGHTAKYGTYTLIDTESDKIVTFEVVQKSEVNNSACMEKEGLIRCLNKLQNHEVLVEQLATDRHPQIVCHMKKTSIAHQFDVWHVSKSVVKKLTLRAKGKRCNDLRLWIRSVANHLWWSCATCGGDYTTLRDKWTSVLHHVANIHEWGHSQVFTCCEHEPLSPEELESTPWLEPGTPAHDALKDVVMEKKLLADLQRMTRFAHTGSLEVYHSMLTKYCPKRQHFSYEGMQARTMLAALDHNNNTRRDQATTSSGAERFKYEWSKISKTWVVKPISVGKDYSYLGDLLMRVISVREQKIKLPLIKKPQDLPHNIAPEPRPEKEVLLQRHSQRFLC